MRDSEVSAPPPPSRKLANLLGFYTVGLSGFSFKFGVWGWGFRVWVWGWWFEVGGVGIGVRDSGSGVWGLELGI